MLHIAIIAVSIASTLGLFIYPPTGEPILNTIDSTVSKGASSSLGSQIFGNTEESYAELSEDEKAAKSPPNKTILETMFPPSDPNKKDPTFSDYVDGQIDSLDEYLEESIEDGNIDENENPLDTTEEEAHNVRHGAINTIRGTWDMAKGFHEFIVAFVFLGSPIDIDPVIIIMISVVVSVFFVKVMLDRIGSHGVKVGLIIIGFVTLVLVFGTNIDL